MTQDQLSRRAVLAAVGGSTLAFCLGCTATSGSGADSGPVTVKTTDIPVGSGKIVGRFVVTQPSAGKYEAFSNLCTHQNLPVQQVSTTAIVCGRHGSSYSLTDGSVLTGPATKALAKATLVVSGDTITVS